MKLSNKQLIRDLVADLVADIRFCNRNHGSDQIKYRDNCLAQVRELYLHRHTVKLDQFGWPKLPTFKIDRSSANLR